MATIINNKSTKPGYGAEWSLEISLDCSGAADKVDQVCRETHDVGGFTFSSSRRSFGLVEHGGQEKEPEHVLTAHGVSTAHIVISWYVCKTRQACDR